MFGVGRTDAVQLTAARVPGPAVAVLMYKCLIDSFSLGWPLNGQSDLWLAIPILIIAGHYTARAKDNHSVCTPLTRRKRASLIRTPFDTNDLPGCRRDASYMQLTGWQQWIGARESERARSLAEQHGQLPTDRRCLFVFSRPANR